jgi:exodeoxyribonuclease VII large subunit
LVIEYIEPKGVGALQLAFEQLKQKLMKEGLFDKAHKKPLPFLPQKIGVVTSSTGAALKDILRVIERRFANVQITLYPVRVQGEEAPAEIAEAIRAFNHLPSLGRDLPMVDVIIVGRGGGSLEDLWAFNEEVVARAVFDSSIPVISAVGHEIDVTILDMVADTRAPTPSAAAEMVVSNKEDVVRRLNDLKSRLINSARAAINVYTERLEGLSGRSPFAMPFERTARLQQQADELTARLNREIEVAVKAAGERFTGTRQSLHLLAPTNLINRYHDRVFTNYRGIVSSLTSLIENKSHIFKELAGRMNSMSPLAVMERGYSICYKLPEMEVINDSSALSSGDGLRIRFSRGSAVCRIEDRILEGDDNVGN